MSRIGERKLVIPEGVTINVENNNVLVKGSKGELSIVVNPLVEVAVVDNAVITKKNKDNKEANVFQGTTNSLI